MAAVRLLCLAALFALALAQNDFPFPSPGGSFDGCANVRFCLSESQKDCGDAFNGNNECAAGLYCRVSNVLNTTTDNYDGTCIKAARLGEACSLDTTSGTGLGCYDPKWPNAIYCDDPQLNGTGTCRYRNIYVPGEQCSTTSSIFNDVEGGCVINSCTGGSCPVTAAGGPCRSSNASTCAFNTYCDFTNSQAGVGQCAARKAKGVQCDATSRDTECDHLLICTTRGNLLNNPTCLDPFVGNEGDRCTDEKDCKAGLLCNQNDHVCAKPSPYKKDFCQSNSDCQFGYDCECLYEISGNKLAERGGRCTDKRSITQDQINKWKKFQQCAKDTSCRGDFAWFEQYAGNSAPYINGLTGVPASCVWNCLQKAGYAKNVAPNVKEGKCFSSAAAIFPAMAIVIAALLALLF
jgi:hypothetical protein